MPRGGRRPGAGRKPAGELVKFVRNARGSTQPNTPTATPVVSKAAIDPPAILSLQEREIWDAWAPLAIAAGTLVVTTVPAFLHLCALEADHRTLRARLAGQDGHPLLVQDDEIGWRREVRALALAVRSGLKDFMIAPFGKEIVDRRGDERADPLDEFMRDRRDV